jgi:hypothetical protein
MDGVGADSAGSPRRKVVRLKTQDLYVSAAAMILFRTPDRAADSFMSTAHYAQNEGMLEGQPWSPRRPPSEFSGQPRFWTVSTSTLAGFHLVAFVCLMLKKAALLAAGS